MNEKKLEEFWNGLFPKLVEEHESRWATPEAVACQLEGMTSEKISEEQFARIKKKALEAISKLAKEEDDEHILLPDPSPHSLVSPILKSIEDWINLFLSPPVQVQPALLSTTAQQTRVSKVIATPKPDELKLDWLNRIELIRQELDKGIRFRATAFVNSNSDSTNWPLTVSLTTGSGAKSEAILNRDGVTETFKPSIEADWEGIKIAILVDKKHSTSVGS